MRSALETTLSMDELTKLTLTERNARRQKALGALIAKYPHEYLLYREQWNSAQQLDRDSTAVFDAYRERWENEAKAHPDDPMALMMAGKVQADKDSAEAIRLFEAARTKAPDFSWPSYELSELYMRGTYADEAKFKESLERFYALCPAWTAENYYANQAESYKLRKDLPLVAKTAAALRADLAQESDTKRLEDYKILWQREFLTRPPSEHDAERAQIRQDLARLEKAVPNGDAEWRLFLISGYEQAGATNEELTAMRLKAAQDFPHQAPAERLEREAWDKAHPQPEGQKDEAAWKAYYAAKVEQVKQWMQNYPDDAYLQRTEFYFTVQDDPYTSEADGVAAVDRYEQAIDEYGGYGILSAAPSDPAKFLITHGWQPEKALALLKKTSTYKNGGHTKETWSTSLDADTVKSFHRYVVSTDLETLGLILEAAALADRPDEALKFRAVIEEPPPDNKKALTQYWTNRARLAALDHHPQDALAYYRIALDDRMSEPEYAHGVLRDNLTAEFHTLWTKQGGSETAWTAWNTPPANDNINAQEPEAATTAAAKPAAKTKKATQTAAAKEGDWEKVTAKMPSFEMSDFAGRQWRQSELAGKVVVVVSWATWCGPCHLQDAMLQKFYDKVKDRKDLVVMSFNIDENPGQVLPFMRKQGYTFPVLAASSFEEAQKVIPKTWIIDKHGNWQWMKVGYDDEKTYPEFEKDMLGQIGKVEAGQ
ncbi:TlpA family protein disulfide reductase [Silvibacterium sp.]|uniref:TlpA family protein disulfide reductase n=1 Tax=Silvibacterium sp. TaxID=1964179 RepID=UPI0039E4B33C